MWEWNAKTRTQATVQAVSFYKWSRWGGLIQLQSDSSSLMPECEPECTPVIRSPTPLRSHPKTPDLGRKQPRVCAELQTTEPSHAQLKENFIPHHFSPLMLIRSSLFVSAHIWDLRRLLQIGLSALWSKWLDSGLPVWANTLLILPSSGIWYEPDFCSPLLRLSKQEPLSLRELHHFVPG